MAAGARGGRRREAAFEVASLARQAHDRRGRRVERVIQREYVGDCVEAVQAMLGEYGLGEWHREPDRVRLAALKLAAGSMERLRYEIEGAKGDYRDVLGKAEYPGYRKRMFRIDELPEEERQKIIDDDWKQYQDWLGRR
jgi:hypothetical protein